MTTINNISDIRAALCQSIKYIQTLKKEEITSDIEAELLLMHGDIYKLIDAVDRVLNVPRITPQGRVEEEEE
jgi:hypothetical protein